MRARVVGRVALLAWAACGRVGFDTRVETGVLAIWPADVEIGIGEAQEFRAAGGASPYRFELVDGPGTLDADAIYRAPLRSGVATVRVTDAVGDSREATITTFAPSEIPGLLLWLDAGSLPLADGALVAAWPDRDGRALAASQPAMAKQPRFVGDGIGGRPAVAFTDLVTALRTQTIPFGTFTIASVFRANNAGIIYEHSFGTWLQTDVDYTINVDTSSYNLGSHWGRDEFARVAVHRFDGTHVGHTLRVDGRDLTLAAGSSGSPGTGTRNVQLDIGSRGDGADWWLDGAIAEILVFDRPLDAGDAHRIECYLGARYAIGVPGCSPALRASPAVAVVAPGEALDVVATGGLAPYRFERVSGPGTIDAAGRFVAGAAGTSVVEVTDRAGHLERVVIEAQASIPLDGIEVWLRASDLLDGGLADGAAVEAWVDRGPHHHVARQRVVSRQPHVLRDGINGQPAVACDGAALDDADHLAADYPQLGSFTAFAVFSARGRGIVWGHGRGTWLMSSTDATIQVERPPNYDGSAKDLVDRWAEDGVPRVVAQVYDGTHAGHRLYIAGIDQTLRDVAGETLDPGVAPYRAPFAVCGWRNDYNLPGHVAEVLIYRRVLSPAERVAVEAALAARYGL